MTRLDLAKSLRPALAIESIRLLVVELVVQVTMLVLLCHVSAM